MQAIILAAGMGRRLKDLTKNNTKCMIQVNGVTLIERMLEQLEELNLSRIIMVVGYEKDSLIAYIKTLNIKTPIVYVENPIYSKTNNIYSLYLAKKYLLEEDTLLLESDLIFQDGILKKLVENPYPSLALVAKFENWMDGTVVTLDVNNRIKQFIPKNKFVFEEMATYFKTVNIYKFSKAFSTTHYVPFLEAYCKALGNNSYYEQVLRVITLLDKPEIKALRLEDELWYEIEDIQDLDIAESIFTESKSKFEKVQNRYGGYWRYPSMIDFSYLVNPLFPNQKLMDEIKVNFENLLCSYPSGLRVNNLLVAKYFGINQAHICVGNGAAELIKSVLSQLTGKLGVIYPTFEEYPNRVAEEDIVAYYPQNDHLTYTADDLIQYFSDKNISMLVVINPNNPVGNLLERTGLNKLLSWSKEKNIILIIDESFIDFADICEQASLLHEDVLEENKQLIVIKSISKSFGVPGLRLGILASGNSTLINGINKDISIWNINSFAEYYLQIFEKYKGEYRVALKKFLKIRERFFNGLKTIPYIRPIPSQANFIMCEVIGQNSSKELCEILLDEYNVLVKDLSHKKGFGQRQFIRIAIRNQCDNDVLIQAMRSIQQ